MAVTRVDKDPWARTITITAEFGAGVPRVWRLWADPGQLAGWWGPPGHPVTVEHHDLSPGGRVRYRAAGPGGEVIAGWWDVRSVDAPHGLDFDLGGPGLPVAAVRVRLTGRAGGGTRMTVEATFASAADLDTMALIGFAEGMSTAVAQIDALLG